ncbi:MAG TPA: DNA mismatch repair protein, partial [Leptospiraceae bacterium]|nr:DNA mismatch repair protein [Leptospiraceae bacterium]
RNEDSLSEGISFFYSEVKKLRFILETVSDKNNRYIVLIDEVLKGTNTRERLIASSLILQKLIKSGAVSFVTTHDLALAKKKNAKIRLRHFKEDVDKEGKMIFGYKIQKGLVSSTNALRVLKSEVPDLFK